jgi:hypothetical protein
MARPESERLTPRRIRQGSSLAARARASQYLGTSAPRGVLEVRCPPPAARRKTSVIPIEGSNWFASRSRPDEKAWRRDRELLEREHRQLRAAIAALSSQKGRRVPEALLFGVAFHDVYHAGQIQLLKRWQAQARRG